MSAVEVETDGAPHSDHASGTEVGKRYVDEETGTELLCTRAGSGSLSMDGRPLMLKGAKPLPASD